MEHKKKKFIVEQEYVTKNKFKKVLKEELKSGKHWDKSILCFQVHSKLRACTAAILHNAGRTIHMIVYTNEIPRSPAVHSLHGCTQQPWIFLE